jgi:hypothetical protein
VVVRLDDGGGPLPGALGAGAVTVCRVLTVRLAVLGKSCDFSDEILEIRAMDSGQFELGAYRCKTQAAGGGPVGPFPTANEYSRPLRPVANIRFGALKFRRYELQSSPPQLWMVGLYCSWLV